MAMRNDNSWGYNSRTPPDSDTTAHAVLLLHAVGEVLDECYGRLLLFQQPDGGIATFTRRDTRDSWGMSHPDVSAVALQALYTGLPISHPAMQLGLTYVRNQLGSDGLWQSFWWTTPLYSTLVNVRFLETVGAQYERRRVVQGVLGVSVGDCIFPNALLGELLANLTPDHPRASEAQRYLLEMQLPDGSWDSCPMLRVTSLDVTKPWSTHNDPGPVAADLHRLFTTATAVRSLAILDWSSRHLPGSRPV
jgi:squalene cyclase